MKKKLLIMMNSMEIGGIEKALLSLLSVLDRGKFDVTILFVKKYGEYLNQIPMWVKVEEIEIPNFERSILENGTRVMIGETLRSYKYFSALKLIVAYVKRTIALKIRSNYHNSFEILFKNSPEYKGHYDMALDFFGCTSFTTYYIAEKVNADIKASWLHSSDFDNEIINFRYYYNKYNRIFGVSKACVEKFSGIFPEFSNKCDTFYNILLSDDIKWKAEIGRGFEEKFTGIKIVTVGRLSVAKGYDVAIAAASKLKKDGFKFKWYVIGEGSERLKLEKLIQNYHVDDCFVLLGSTDNPYPYMKQCDIYVQPSRYEGYCITLAEARILKKAIITTNFFGAKEQIIDGETGLIINFDEENIYKAVKKLLTNTELRLKFEENLAKEKMENSKDVEKIYELVDDRIEKQNKIKKNG